MSARDCLSPGPRIDRIARAIEDRGEPVSLDVDRAAARACTAEIRGPGLDRHPRASRHRGARPARDALDQHRHALQHHLPELLHRIEPQQRSASLHHRGGGRRLLRRDRGPGARHARDRVHGRRAVHEPATCWPWWAMRCVAASRCWCCRTPCSPCSGPKVKRGLLELAGRYGAQPHHPRQPRPLHAGVARGGARRRAPGSAHSPVSTG